MSERISDQLQRSPSPIGHSGKELRILIGERLVRRSRFLAGRILHCLALGNEPSAIIITTGYHGHIPSRLPTTPRRRNI